MPDLLTCMPNLLTFMPNLLTSVSDLITSVPDLLTSVRDLLIPVRDLLILVLDSESRSKVLSGCWLIFRCLTKFKQKTHQPCLPAGRFPAHEPA